MKRIEVGWWAVSNTNDQAGRGQFQRSLALGSGTPSLKHLESALCP